MGSESCCRSICWTIGWVVLVLSFSLEWINEVKCDGSWSEGSVVPKNHTGKGECLVQYGLSVRWLSRNYSDPYLSWIRYSGQWKEGKMDGNGTYWSSLSGFSHTGSWRNNLRDGPGIWSLKHEGIKLSGSWMADRLTDPGSIIQIRADSGWIGSLPSNLLSPPTVDFLNLCHRDRHSFSSPVGSRYKGPVREGLMHSNEEAFSSPSSSVTLFDYPDLQLPCGFWWKGHIINGLPFSFGGSFGFKRPINQSLLLQNESSFSWTAQILSWLPAEKLDRLSLSPVKSSVNAMQDLEAMSQLSQASPSSSLFNSPTKYSAHIRIEIAQEGDVSGSRGDSDRNGAASVLEFSTNDTNSRSWSLISSKKTPRSHFSSLQGDLLGDFYLPLFSEILGWHCQQLLRTHQLLTQVPFLFS